MYDIRDLLARNLKRLRAERRINQEELAEEIGVSKETIAKTEIRQNWLGAENLNKLIEFFGIQPFELFTDGDGESPLTKSQLAHIKAELKKELLEYINAALDEIRADSRDYSSPKRDHSS